MIKIKTEDVIKVKLTPEGVKAYHNLGSYGMPEIDIEGYTTLRVTTLLKILRESGLVMSDKGYIGKVESPESMIFDKG